MDASAIVGAASAGDRDVAAHVDVLPHAVDERPTVRAAETALQRQVRRSDRLQGSEAVDAGAIVGATTAGDLDVAADVDVLFKGAHERAYGRAGESTLEPEA